MPTLSITPPPSEILQSERPVVVKVSSQDIADDNIHPEIIWSMDDAIASTNVTFTFQGFTFTTRNDQPIENPLQFKSDVVARQNLIDAMNNVPVLSRDWQFYKDGSSDIVARRKFPGPLPGLTVESNHVNFAIESTEEGSGDTFGDTKEGYKVLVRVYANFLPSTSFPNPSQQRPFKGELALSYNSDNQYDFDLSPLLGDEFKDFLPSLSTGFQRVLNSVLYYNYEVLEGYNDDSSGVPVRYRDHVSFIDYKVIFGKKGFIDFEDYWSGFPHKPLMSDFSERLVRRSEDQFLIFFYDQVPGTLELEINITFRNGTTSTVNRESRGMIGAMVHYVNVGFTALDLQDEESEFLIIRDYTVKVIDSDAPQDVTTPVKYVPYNSDEPVTTIAFQNDFGMYELFTFAGNNQRGANYKITEHKRALPIEEDISNIERAILSNDSEFKRVLHSHGLKESVFDALSDLVTSEQVYLVEEGVYIPVIIKEMGYLRDYKNSLYFISITVVPSQQKVLI